MKLGIEQIGGPRAFRLVFSKPGDAEGKHAFRITRPREIVVLFQSIGVDEVLATTSNAKPNESSLELIFLPGGSGTPYELQSRAENWILGPLSGRGPAVEVSFRSERIIWRPGQGVWFGSTQFADDVLAALAHFDFCESELRQLEQEVELNWMGYEKDVDLTHSIRADDLIRQSHVDHMTRAVTMMRIRQVRIEKAFEAPAQELIGPAKRIFSELAIGAQTVDRLTHLDDAIEVGQDLYESANDRLSEFRYFYREFRLEILILLALIGELVIMLYEAAFNTK